jgi:putative glutamine amidotransferase
MNDGGKTMGTTKPMIAVLCCGGSLIGRDMQFLANRFLAPLVSVGASAFLVPTIPEAVDVARIAGMCDGLLLTGSNTNVSPTRYESDDDDIDADHGRDEVALSLAEAMIGLGRPVLGICRGMQELNVLHGGSLRALDDPDGLHMRKADWADHAIFDHGHDVTLTGRHLRPLSDAATIRVASIHRQGIARLGTGLEIEAVAEDGVTEAFSGHGGQVVGVQWHPELMRDAIDARLFQRLAMRA